MLRERLPGHAGGPFVPLATGLFRKRANSLGAALPTHHRLDT